MSVAQEIVNNRELQEYLDEMDACDGQLTAMTRNKSSMEENLVLISAQLVDAEARLEAQKIVFQAAVQTCLDGGQTPDEVAANTMQAAQDTDLIRDEIVSLAGVKGNYETDIVGLQLKIDTVTISREASRQKYVEKVAQIMGQPRTGVGKRVATAQ